MDDRKNQNREPENGSGGGPKNRQEAMHMPYIGAGCKILVTPEKDGHVDLVDLMRQLGQLGIDSVILEGGGTLNWSALQAGNMPTIMRWYGARIDRNPSCAVCSPAMSVLELGEEIEAKLEGQIELTDIDFELN